MAIGAFGDFNALLKSTGRGYATLATSIAAKYSMEQVWSQFPLFRGMLAEAKFASNYISKGFEWMAETSPFFRKFDFYNISSGTAISLKTVNASKNFDFKNILKNIEELGEIKRAGSSVQYGREFKINEAQLDILIPKDYNKEVLNEIKKAAKNENVKVNIIRG